MRVPSRLWSRCRLRTVRSYTTWLQKSTASRRFPRARNPGAGWSSAEFELSAMLEPRARERLEAVLARARELGFVGPGPVAAHINHSLAFANAAAEDDRPPPRF